MYGGLKESDDDTHSCLTDVRVFRDCTEVYCNVYNKVYYSTVTVRLVYCTSTGEWLELK